MSHMPAALSPSLPPSLTDEELLAHAVLPLPAVHARDASAHPDRVAAQHGQSVAGDQRARVALHLQARQRQTGRQKGKHTGGQAGRHRQAGRHQAGQLSAEGLMIRWRGHHHSH